MLSLIFLVRVILPAFRDSMTSGSPSAIGFVRDEPPRITSGAWLTGRRSLGKGKSLNSLLDCVGAEYAVRQDPDILLCDQGQCCSPTTNNAAH